MVKILITFKVRGFFRKKTLKLFKIPTCGQVFLECVSNGFFPENVFPTYSLYLRFFRQKSEKKTKIGKVRKYDEGTEFFEKNAFILLKGIFNNVGGRKISRR